MSQPTKERLDAVTRTAQYLATIEPGKDIWPELGRIAVHFMKVDLAAFAATRRNRRLTFHHCVGSTDVCKPLQKATAGIICQVLESGFLAHETLRLDDADYSLVFLPLAVDSRTSAVMILGRRNSAAPSRDTLNYYLAIAGLFSSTLTRLSSQQRFFAMADNVPEMLFRLIRYADGVFEFAYVSGGSRAALNLAPAELLSDAERFLARLAPDERIVFESVMGKPGGRVSRIFRMLAQDDQERFLLLNAMPNPREDGSIIWDGAMQDLTEHKRMEDERKENLLRLERSMEATVEAIASTIEKRDPYTAGHQRRVAELARRIGEELKLSQDEIQGISLAASIHDIGKIHIPAEILSFPGELGKIEFDLVKTHAEIGYEILKVTEFPWPVAQMVLQHHERMDGSGYPSHLHGDQILLGARIIAVADVVESIASYRPYRPALGVPDALDEISQHRDSLYDAVVVDACVRLFNEKNYRIGAN